MEPTDKTHSIANIIDTALMKKKEDYIVRLELNSSEKVIL